MSESASLRIGVDLGGTKIEVLALDLEGTALERRRIATPRDDYAGTLTAVADLVHGLERDLARRGSVGVGIPGAISPATGLVKNANSTWLNGKPLDRDLARALGRPVRLANDANCFALSEAIDGAAAGTQVVFGVIMGTGTGGGIAIGGRPLRGRNAIAGEWGHNPLPWPRDDERPGPPCYCGKHGCIETFLSGPGLARDHAAVAGETLTAAAIAARAAEGEAQARRSMARHRERTARALAHVVNILDPDVVVLGGGLSNIAGLAEAMPDLLGPHVFSDRVDTPVVRARHGDSSGVRGAAWLWAPDELAHALEPPP